MNPAATGGDTASGRYQLLSTFRSPYLQRARDCAVLTIPSLMPPEGSTGSTNLQKPYQSIGARGVNNLASKLLLALLPPNQSFFRFLLDDATIEEVAGTPDLKTELDAGLVKIERTVQVEVETTPTRVSVFEALKQLIVTGNVLLQVLPNGGLKAFRLDSYVVKRDPAGNVLEIVIVEKIAPTALPKAFLRALQSKDEELQKSPQKSVEVHTWLRRQGEQVTVQQEVKGKVVPGTTGSYPLGKCPFIPLRWTKIDGEDYGRGHAEEYYGDLRSLEALRAAIVEGSAAAAKVVMFVDPTGTTQIRTVADAPNLAVRSGKATDVSVLKLDKSADFSVAMNTADNIKRDLSSAFLMTSSVQRNGERVTAEEIRLLAGELEDALGGVYALLSQEMQLPFVSVLLANLERRGKVPALPKNVRPAIVTGLAALGRSHELNRLMMLGRAAKELLGESATAYLNPTKVIAQIATSVGVQTEGIIKTEDEIAKERQDAQRSALVQQLGPEVVRSQSQKQGAPSGEA